VRVGREDEPEGPGRMVFVATEQGHRFHSIPEALESLVLFAPAEPAGPAPQPTTGPPRVGGRPEPPSRKGFITRPH